MIMKRRRGGTGPYLKGPGPGLLPPFLAEQLHANHSLFSVSITEPDRRLSGQVLPLSLSAHTSSSPDARATSRTSLAPPTAEEVRTAVPHPDAYYCPKENGWVILSWKSSVALPLAQSFQDSRHPPLPNQDRRKRTESCVADNTRTFGQTHATHHFHKYESAIDAHKLTPPFRREEWEEIEQSIKDNTNNTKMNVEEIDVTSGSKLETNGEGRLFDLYVCCQCSFYCVISGVIPGVIPRKSFDDFAKEKMSNPPSGKTGEHAVVTAFDTIVT